MDNAISTMSTFGIIPTCPLEYDKIVRFCSDGKRNNKDCWYICKEFNGSLYVNFGDWSQGISETYTSFAPGKSEKEIKQIKEEFERIKKESEKLRNEEAKSTALKAREMWEGLKEGNHPYLVKKKIKAHGARRYKNSLVIPIFKNGKIMSLQFIDSSGKRFMSGGEISGGAYVIKGTKEYIVICEGFSTGASIFESTGYQTFISFNAGNLSKVAKRAKDILPKSKIIIACDNDKYKKNNTGVEKGTYAAGLIGGLLAIPEFKNESTKPTDFNDLFILEGQGMVREQITPESSKMAKSIKEWCSKFNGTFTTTEIFNQFGIKDKQQKNEIENILADMCKDNIIQPDGKKRSSFRVVDSKIITMKVTREHKNNGVDIVLPFGLSESVIIEDRNLIVIAGESNAGKTALLLQNMLDNILLSNQFGEPVYISSEMSESEFSNRALPLLDDPEVWNQSEIIDKSNNFQDVISRERSDKLVYIDLLEASSDIGFSDMEAELKQIRDSLNSGVAVVAMQKTKGKDLARGGDGTLSKSRLYISLHNCYKGDRGDINRAVIEKCKMVKKGKRNPEGMQIFYQITKVGGIELVSEWGWFGDIKKQIDIIKKFNPEKGGQFETVTIRDDYKNQI